MPVPRGRAWPKTGLGGTWPSGALWNFRGATHRHRKVPTTKRVEDSLVDRPLSAISAKKGLNQRRQDTKRSPYLFSILSTHTRTTWQLVLPRYPIPATSSSSPSGHHFHKPTQQRKGIKSIRRVAPAARMDKSPLTQQPRPEAFQQKIVQLYDELFKVRCCPFARSLPLPFFCPCRDGRAKKKTS